MSSTIIVSSKLTLGLLSLLPSSTDVVQDFSPSATANAEASPIFFTVCTQWHRYSQT